MKMLVAMPCKRHVFRTFFTRRVIDEVNSLCEVDWNDSEERLRKEELCQKIVGCDAYVVCWGDPGLDEEVMRHADRLKLLVVLGSTVTPFVSEAMWKRGVRVISGADFFSRSTAEGTIAYMLASLRNIPFFTNRLVNDRVWAMEDDYTDGLIYKSVGIISYGGVGRHVVRMLQPFDVSIKVYDIVEISEAEQKHMGFTQCGIEEIFSECDIVSIHTPHNPSSDKMINDSLLSLMKDGALLINTARGGVVDQEALTKHLSSGRIRAALDVYEKEPIDMDDPLLDMDTSSVLLIPHMGGVTTNLRERVATVLFKEAVGFINNGGDLPNEISYQRAALMSFH